MEQIYKFRNGQVDSVADIKSKLKDSFYDEIIQIFNTMKTNRDGIFREDDLENEKFDVII